MKSKITAAIAAIAIVSAQFAFAAGGPVPPTPVAEVVNPLNIARACALKQAERYQCFLQGEMLIGGAFQYTTFNFTMEKDFSITRLIVNGTEIPVPSPIYGLPLGDGGLIRNVYLSVYAATATGEEAGQGWLQKEAVSKGESLVVTLIPAGIRTELSFDASSYGEGDLRVEIEGFQHGYSYGLQNGHLFVDLPPIGGRYHYLVRRWQDGVVVGDGWIQPFAPAVAENDSYVGVKWVGGVVGVSFSQPNGLDDYASIADTSFDCDVPLANGSTVKGKVVFLDVSEGGLDVMAPGSYYIYIQSAESSDVNMPFLPVIDFSTNSNGWITTEVATMHNHAGKLVVTIIPKPSSTVSGSTWINFHRFYGTPVSGGGRG